MAPDTRGDGKTKKRKHAQREDPSAKRLKKDGDSKRNPRQTGVSTAQPRQLAVSSVLKQEEKSFPRGGGGVLTPLEHKQIQIQAQQDVLFEDAGEKRVAKDDLGSEEATAVGENISNQSSKKRKEVKPRKDGTVAAKEPKVRVSGLKFKQLQRGSIALGQIARISDHDILLDLPNNLTGTVPLTSISDPITKKLEALALAEGSDGDAADTADGEDGVGLRSIFQTGQYLRASVLSTVDETGGKADLKAKKKIELSIEPREVNRGLSSSNICINSTVQASVASVEDHGLVMDLGLKDSSTKGFMATKDIPQGYNLTDIKEGAVILCLITEISSNGKVAKLSANHNSKDSGKARIVRSASSVDVLLPGTATELLITHVSNSGIMGKLMGLIDATADTIHAGGSSGKGLGANLKEGTKINVRIIYSISELEAQRIGLSMLDHILRLSTPVTHNSTHAAIPTDELPLSAFVESATVVRAEPGFGIYLDVGIENATAFVHASRVSDTKKTISEDDGPFRLGTTHRARILGYNGMDALFLASLEQSILDQPFLRLEDVPVGDVVKTTVERLVVNAIGVAGVVLKITQGITGFVPELHLADVRLQHPERKFKEGTTVTARVISVDTERRQIRLTLKKSLVNSDASFWTEYDRIEPESWCPGTIVKVDAKGAVLQFFGSVKGFLPAVEMSSDYIRDPTQHFRVGQTLNVRAKSIDPANERLSLSCRTATIEDLDQIKAYNSLKIGDVVSGTISSKSLDDLNVKLDGSELNATLRLGHLTDGTKQRNESAMKQLRLGQALKDLVVIELFPPRRSIVLSKKPSILKATKAGKFLSKLEDVEKGVSIDGFARSVTSDGIFVQFGAGLVGLLPSSQVAEYRAKLPDFGIVKDQTVSATVLSVDHNKERFLLTMKELTTDSAKPESTSRKTEDASSGETVDPVDESMRTTADFAVGKITKAKITSVKDTQLNVMLAQNVQGRIDISEVFTKFEDVKDRKKPLRQFRSKEVIPVKILGIHDAKSHSFLPISHRGRKFPVFELSARTEVDEHLFSLDQVELNMWYTAFVNNSGDNCLWVNLSPSVRGRLESMEVSDDVSIVNNLDANFPAGSALRVRVKSVDIRKGRLDLSTKPADSEQVTYDRLSVGMLLTGRVTKVTERTVLVQLSGSVAGQIPLTELADDYSKADPGAHSKNDVVRVCVVDIDRANKRLTLSARPSKVLSSSSPVKDPAYSNANQLKVNNVVRGFIKHVADVGVFVSLSHLVTAFVRVSELSDSFLKDWKSSFEIDRFVTGKVISVDENTQHLQLSLKESVLSKDYVPKLTFNDLTVGQVVAGKVRKVEDFGAFIVIDDSHNVSGLAHRSEIAEHRVEDVRKLYSEGDRVKAVVLKIEPEKRRVSFGLKVSYFENASDDGSSDDGGASLPVVDDMDVSEAEGDAEMEDDFELDADSEIEEDEETGDEESGDEKLNATEMNKHDGDSGLEIGAFDWNGAFPRDETPSAASESEEDEDPAPKKKRRKPTIKVDATGDLDANGPRSSSDFERLLLSQRDSSSLWIQYMAFQLQLGEVDEARKLAERALHEIGMREQEEKMNVWIAYLNLENAYGSEETLDEVFARACAYNDPQQIHERLTSIYIESGKHEKADDLFRAMIRNKSFNAQTSLWLNYATFILTTLNEPARARSILDRAMQSVPAEQHRDLVAKFGALEFRSPNGDPERGRTIFEGLLATYPKNWSLWDMLIELEEGKRGERSNARRLYERMATMKMKSRRAKKMFKKWLEFEEREGSEKNLDRVKAKAAEFVEKQRERHTADGSED